MSRIIKANTQYTIVFSQSTAENAEAVAKLLNIRDKRLFSWIPAKYCVLKRNEGILSGGVLVKLHDFPLPEQDSPPQSDSHSHVKAEPPLTEIKEVMQEIKKFSDKFKNSDFKRSGKKDISQMAYKCFHVIIGDEPFTPISKEWSKVSSKKLNPEKKEAIINFLEEQDLIKFTKVRIASSNQLIPAVTKKGAEKAGIVFPQAELNEGIEHKAAKSYVKRTKLKEGLKVSEEKQFSPKRRGDIVVEDADGRLHIFEIISTSKRNIISHLKLSFECPQVQDVTIVTFTKGEFKDIKKQIKAESDLAQYKDRILFECLDKYLKALWG